MIKRKKPSENFTTNFVATDIENDQQGNLLAIGTSWRCNGILQHTVWHTWGEWWEWVKVQAKEYQCFRTIYAHNGGGWDWVGFFEWYLTQQKSKRISVSVVTAQSKMILMDIEFLHTEWQPGDDEKPDVDLTIRFCDSLYLLRSSLSKLAEKMLGEKKLEDDIKVVWDSWLNDKPRFYKYLRIDCDLLLKILEKSLDILRENVGKIDKLGVTIGSTAMKVYRTMGMDDYEKIDIPFEKKVKEFLREGYRGGRVEVFKYGYQEKIHVYDINSLYPSAMVNCEVPISANGGWTNIFRKKLPGCYRIRFKQCRTDIFPVLMIDGKGTYEGEGVFFTPEILLLMEVDPRAKIEFMEGYVFFDSGKPFDKYVHTLYNLRLTDSDGPISLLAKYLLNSLYGKFGQKSRRSRLVLFESWEAVNAAEAKAKEKGWKFEPFRPESLLYRLEEETEVEFEHVGIAGMITSQARVILYRMMMEAGCKNVVYCDTDSVHTTSANLDRHISTALGKVKLEFSGEGVYCGKKLYALRDTKKATEKIRAKGVSVGGRHGCELHFTDLLAISNGAEKECEFSQPATVIQVINGRMKSCILGKKNRKRTLRLT